MTYKYDNYIKRVMIAGMTSYKSKLMKSFLPAGNPGFNPLQLGTHYNSLGRWRKKVMAKDDWYTDKEATADDDQAGANRGGRMRSFQTDGNRKTDVKIETSTVMFIPSTRGGLLTSMMRERETEMSRITRFKVKMQESGGIQLARLFSTDLGQPCGRQDCQPCKGSEGRKNCKKA